MKHLMSVLSLACAVCMCTFIQTGCITSDDSTETTENLFAIVEDAQNSINRRYTGLANKTAMDELEMIVKSSKSDEQKIAAIRKKFLGGTAVATQAKSTRTVTQNKNYASLIYHPPLQWQIQSIEIAYDLDSVTQSLFSAESLYQEEENKSREELKGSSNVTNVNMGAKTRFDLNVGGGINVKGWNPLNWFQAKTDFQWVSSGHLETDDNTTKTTQWNDRSKRALSNNYEEKTRILQDSRITKCHLTFYILFNNNTDKDLLLDPQSFSVTVYAGEKSPVADAFPDTKLRSFRIPRNAYADLKFRAELNTTSAINLISYMRYHEPLIRLDRAQATIVSADGIIKDAVQETLRNKTVPFRCRNLELQLLKTRNGKQTTVGDAMRAINEVFEQPWFELSGNSCTGLMGIELSSKVKKYSLNQLPVVVINGVPTSGTISSEKLAQPLSDAGLSVDIVDLIADNNAWKNASDRLQKHFFSYVKPVAESGDVEAQAILGVCYMIGNGVQQDSIEAIKWIRKATEHNFPDAQVILGLCYDYGLGVEKDSAEAVKWYRKAAEQDFSPAQNLLGCCYYDGLGVEKDSAEAVKWYRKAAEQECAEAQYNLGCCYDDGLGVEKDSAEAVKWYRKAAEQDFAFAKYNLGCCYLNGEGVRQDSTEAVKWFRKAAEQECAEAQYDLGRCYIEGIGVQQDSAEAVKWFRKAAEQDCPEAQFFLGGCYYDGEGVRQDSTEAVKWFRKAAEQDYPDAQYLLGCCYCEGEEVRQDFPEAIKWFRKAAEQDYPVAQAALGECYLTGKGVRQDPIEAIKLFRKATEQECAEAQYDLGRCYIEGIGVQQDSAEAVKWFRKAAEQEFAIAQYLLGCCYYYGDGVRQDNTEAAKWLRKAAEQGYEEAKEVLETLDN